MPLGRPRGHEMGALSQQGRSHGMADGRARQKNGSKSKDGIEYQAPGDEEDGDTGLPTSEHLLFVRVVQIATAMWLELHGAR
ncbi:hypothetical protein EKO27_g7111 [Xylaria grammica]|uniref:Uncharacterized protein n=1 Tax=Xylaria grammica TaxID=363999 RepID=A0A439D0T6_9PEZI|nr:hypothetical protein EKO27_g7111 [Xylaria grammica]